MCKNRDSEAMKNLMKFSTDLVFNPYPRPMTEEELMEVIGDCDGYIAGTDHVSAKVLEKCKNLKVISRYGAGVDSVDLAAAKAKGIKVTNTPGANAEAVAELAFGHMMSLARKSAWQSNKLQEGVWVSYVGKQLFQKTIGIIGFGNIGKNVARCATGLDMKIMAYDPYINEEYCKAHNVQIASLDEIYANADVITTHMPLTPETKHMINRETIAKMKDGVILINTARGGIMDEEALYDGLQSGKILGVGLDVYEKEPPMGSKLFELDNVISTPHAGAHTIEAVDNMANMSVENLVTILSGKECPYVVNK